jgi:predicted AAA+ superfamily ATPase
MITIKVGQIREKLNRAPQIPKLFLGPPGIGKSQIVREWAQSLGRKCYVIALNHVDLEDIKGLVYLDPVERRVKAQRGPLIPAEDEEAVIFLDEITNVSKQLLVLSFMMINEKEIGGHRFPKAYIVGAGNETAWGGLELDCRIANRMYIYHVVPDPIAFGEYITNKYVGTEMEKIALLVAAFINAHQDMLLSKFEGDAYATPRSWEFMIQGNSLEIEDIASAVGGGIASTFLAFAQLAEKTTIINDILDTKKEIPKEQIDRLDLLYFICSAVSSRATKEEQVRRLLTFIKQQGKTTDFLYFTLKRALLKGIKFSGTLVDKEDWKNLLESLSI